MFSVVHDFIILALANTYYIHWGWGGDCFGLGGGYPRASLPLYEALIYMHALADMHHR